MLRHAIAENDALSKAGAAAGVWVAAVAGACGGWAATVTRASDAMTRMAESVRAGCEAMPPL